MPYFFMCVQKRLVFSLLLTGDGSQLLHLDESLACGALDQEAKDAFFEAVMKAYLKCKEEARKTYGRNKETD